MIRLYWTLFYLLTAYSLIYAQAQSKVSTVVLNDETIIKGEIIKDTEHELTIVTKQLDTLNYGYRLIQKVHYDQDLSAKQAVNLINPRYFKTEGIFVQANYGIPINLEVGKRMTPHFNLGVQLSLPINQDQLGGNQFGDLIGIAAYSKYNLTRNKHSINIYTDAFLGLAISTGRNTTNNPKPYGGVAIGIHIPNRKKIRFYFDFGLYTLMNKREQILRDTQLTIIRSNDFRLLAQATLLGLEF